MGGKSRCISPQPVEWVKGKVIGSGSFGTVHLAMNKANGSLFVVKSAESGAGLQSLENEANILEKLNSPHIVKSMGREISSGPNGRKRINLFIEYMAGGSLADVAEKFGGTLDERVIRLYTREILLGLNYLHKNGIVHSDLKCKNVLLGTFGDVKLADFGCAKRVKETNSIKSCTSFGGTPLWMAPEVLRNERLDFSADIWSLGCTIIEMATGKPPWGDKISNPMAAVLKIACGNEVPDLPGKFSKEGLDFLKKCLEREPKSRWTSEELLNHPFVSGEFEEEDSRKDVSSPASVLDVADTYYESEESEESPNGSDFTSRNPFLTSRNAKKMEISERKSEVFLMESGNWVTVR
ncbi:hypothetical protein LguiB_021776 [Lonicera macranthoides]